MENASKALLIAGAILICILLIAVAMYIYNSANATVDSAVSQMSQQEKDIYNSKVKSYLGEVVKGSEVKSMIDNIISMNQENVGKSGKFISILCEGNLTNWNTGTNSARASKLKQTCDAANFYDNGENNDSNVKAATGEMQYLKSKINSAKNYKVEADYEAGAIIRVHITQLNESNQPAST